MTLNEVSDSEEARGGGQAPALESRGSDIGLLIEAPFSIDDTDVFLLFLKSGWSICKSDLWVPDSMRRFSKSVFDRASAFC